MLDSQIKVICHTFDCSLDSVEWAEDKADKLILKYGEASSLKVLDELMGKLSDRERWESYDKVALIRFVLKQNYFP